MTSSQGTKAATEGRFPGASSAGNVNESNSWTYFSPHAYVMMRVGRFVTRSSLRGSFSTPARPSSMTPNVRLNLIYGTNEAADPLQGASPRNKLLAQKRHGLQATCHLSTWAAKS